jgi:hypothetical protein
MKPRASLHPALASLLDESIAALAQLDALRLEDLAQEAQFLLDSCAGDESASSAPAPSRNFSRPLQEKFDAFARLLDLSRENLHLMRRSAAASVTQLDSTAAALAGSRHGDN